MLPSDWAIIPGISGIAWSMEMQFISRFSSVINDQLTEHSNRHISSSLV